MPDPQFPATMAQARAALPGPMLGIDTSGGTAVALVGAGQATLVTHAGTRNQAELLAPTISQALGQAGLTPGDLRAIAVGTGPAPFTGLRIGLMTALAMGRALQVPVWGVCALDVLVWEAALAQPRDATSFLAVLDARRKEVYLQSADVRDGELRMVGEAQVATPAHGEQQAEGRLVVGRRDLLGLGGAVTGVNPELLAFLAAWRAARGLETATRPLYLRRPDVSPPAPRKRVTA